MRAHLSHFEPQLSQLVRGEPAHERSAPSKTSAGGVAFGGATCIFIVAAILWAGRRPAPRVDGPAAAPRPSWTQISPAAPIFRLPAGPIAAEPAVADEWRASDGASRRDAMTAGSFAGDGAFLRLALTQRATPFGQQPFFADLAVQAALAGAAIERVGVPSRRSSRFGDISVADASLAAGAVRRACLIFRNDDPRVEISGIACGSREVPFDGAALERLLNCLDYAGANPNAPVADFFARSKSISTADACRMDRIAAATPAPAAADQTATIASPGPLARRWRPRPRLSDFRERFHAIHAARPQAPGHPRFVWRSARTGAL